MDQRHGRRVGVGGHFHPYEQWMRAPSAAKSWLTLGVGEQSLAKDSAKVVE